MVPAPHVEPFHLGQNVPKLLLDCMKGSFQIVGVLLAQGVEVKAVQQLQGGLVHLLVPHVPGHSHAAAGGAGVIDGVALLGGALGVDAQPQALARLLSLEAEGFQLMNGVEDDVVCVLQELLKLVRAVGPAEHVDLTLGHLLLAQPGLIEAAGLGASQIGGQEGIKVVVGEGLLGQQHFAPGTLCQGGEHLAVFPQPLLVDDIGRGGKRSKQGLGGVVSKARKLGIL